MANTSLAAVLDDNIVHVEYFFDPSTVDNTVADVTFSLIHQYVQSNGTAQEVVLQEFVVPGNLLTTSGAANTSMPLQQRSSIRLLNPRYRTNLLIQAQEVRSGSPVTTRAPVLVDSGDVNGELPSNPVKEALFQENQPKIVPYTNVISEDLALDPVLYSLQREGVQAIQSSRRLYLGPGGSFLEAAFGAQTTPSYIENAITNFLPNMSLISTSPQALSAPDSYVLVAPGFVLGQNVIPGDLPEQKIWQIRANLPSFLSAFNVLTIRTQDPVTIPQGLETLTSSLYYQITSVNSITPFQSLTTRLYYLDAVGNQVGTATQTTPVAAEGLSWNLLTATFTNIPVSATQVRWNVETDAVESTDKFVLLVTLPQLEASSLATTRAPEPRIQDRYQTGPISFAPPFCIEVQTVHSNGAGLRGLFDTTIGGQNGYQFLVNGNQMQFKVLNPAGGMVLSVFSDPFSATDGAMVAYGVFVDGAQASFYVDAVLVSTTVAVFTQASSQRALVGSFEASNTAVNGPVLDAGVFRDAPGL